MSLHPSIAVIRRGVRAVLEPLAPDTRVMVACSGGADSLALLSATIFEGHKLGLFVIGAVVDHNLQPESEAVSTRVTSQMSAMGCDQTIRAVIEVGEGAGLGPEAAARNARYEVLSQVAEMHEATVVLLGHTRDDQAETVLMGLARGSGGRSIAGMRRSFDRFVRPLLDVSRLDTSTACVIEGLEPWQDPHNSDHRFTRVRVRSVVLPVLEAELGPGVGAALARTADGLREDMEYLDAQADKALARVRQGKGVLVAPLLEALDPAIRKRVLRLAALEAGAIDAELFREHVLNVEQLVIAWRGQKWVDLPGHVKAWRKGAQVLFGAGPADPAPQP